MITISICSKDRPKLLGACLRSIEQNDFMNWDVIIHITSWKDVDEYTKYCDLNDPSVSVRFSYDKTNIQCHNMSISNKRYSHFLPISDHILFMPYTLGSAFRAMQRRFYDYDGVIGLNQYNVHKDNNEEVMLIGNKFLSRFPNYEPFSSGYKHYSVDKEFMMFAKNIGCFSFCPEARVESIDTLE